MYDCVGDVHGCHAELCSLLKELGYVRTVVGDRVTLRHPEGRKVVYVGDLNDRGPDSSAVFALVMDSVACGDALAVIGNHDDKLMRYLKGAKITPGHGLAETIAQLETGTPEFRAKILAFLEKLPIELSLDGGKLSVSHAGLSEDLQGKTNNKAKSRALFGKTTGKTDANGFPERLDWARDYKGSAIVVHGHTPMEEYRAVNNVHCIDQGCCFGGSLTALRYPEMTLVQVKAERNYQPFHPFGKNATEVKEKDTA